MRSVLQKHTVLPTQLHSSPAPLGRRRRVGSALPWSPCAHGTISPPRFGCWQPQAPWGRKTRCLQPWLGNLQPAGVHGKSHTDFCSPALCLRKPCPQLYWDFFLWSSPAGAADSPAASCKERRKICREPCWDMPPLHWDVRSKIWSFESEISVVSNPDLRPEVKRLPLRSLWKVTQKKQGHSLELAA